MFGSPTFDIPRLSIGLTPPHHPLFTPTKVFHPVPWFQTNYLQTEMHVRQIWEYKVWPVKGLEQQLPDFCRDGAFQGDRGSSGVLPQGVCPGTEPGVSFRAVTAVPKPALGVKQTAPGKYRAVTKTVLPHCLHLPEGPWCKSSCSQVRNVLDPSLQPSAEKKKQVFALIPFKDGFFGGEGFWDQVEQEQPGLVEGWGSRDQNEMRFKVPSNPNHPVWNLLHGTLMDLGIFWQGLQSPGLVLLTLGVERMEEVNPSWAGGELCSVTVLFTQVQMYCKNIIWNNFWFFWWDWQRRRAKVGWFMDFSHSMIKKKVSNLILKELLIHIAL